MAIVNHRLPPRSAAAIEPPTATAKAVIELKRLHLQRDESVLALKASLERLGPAGEGALGRLLHLRLCMTAMDNGFAAVITVLGDKKS